MSSYVDPSIVEKINQINMIDYVQQLGYELIKQGNSYKIPGQGGLFIDDKNNRFNCFATKNAGGIIQLAMFLENKEWIGAVNSLVERYNLKEENEMLKDKSEQQIKQNDTSIKENAMEENKEINLPEKDKNSKRVFAYLHKTRGIDNEFIQKAFDEKLIYQSTRGSLIIKLKDENNNNVGAFWQNTVSYDDYVGRGNKGFIKNSKKEYPFEFKGTNNTIYICESPIDMMSFMTLAKRDGSFDKIKDSTFIATWGINSEEMIKKYLEKNPGIKEINICYDNDIDGTLTVNGQKIPHNHGQEKAKELKELLKDRYEVNIITPEAKDFNKVLTNIIEKEKNLEKTETINQISRAEQEDKKETIKEENTPASQNDEEKNNNITEQSKTNIQMQELLKEEKELKKEADKILIKAEELIIEAETLKKNYENTITKIIENKEKQMKLQKENYEEIIKNNAYVMIQKGIDIDTVHNVTKVDKEQLKKIQQEVVNQTGEIMYNVKPQPTEYNKIEEIDFVYNKEEQEELHDVLERVP